MEVLSDVLPVNVILCAFKTRGSLVLL
jgi:hypothetical protein